MGNSNSIETYKHGEEIDYCRAVLTTVYNCNNFDCGNEEINKYIREKAHGDSYAKSYVYLDNHTKKVLGFVTLACSGVAMEYDTTRVTNPAIEIKYFAVLNSLHSLLYNEESKGTEAEKDFNFSDMLFSDVLRYCGEISDEIIGARYIILYSVPKYVSFYEANGFEKFNDYMKPDNQRFLKDCIPMFMEM